MENKLWTKTVGSLIGAIWFYTLADIAGSITEFVNGMLNPGGLMRMIASLTGDGDSAFGMGDMLEKLFPLLVVLGYVLFYSSLSDFMRLQRSEADRTAVGDIRKSYLLLAVAALASCLWLPGRIVALILVIIAYVRLLSGYRRLKSSATFTEEARRGAGLLFASTVWLLVGYVIGCIPVVGSFIEAIISFIVFFTILSGWGRIRRGAPVLSDAEAAEQERMVAAAAWTPERRAKALGIVLLLLLGLPLFFGLIRIAFNYGWIPDTTITIPIPNGTRYFGLYQSLIGNFSVLLILSLYLYLLLGRGLKLGVLSKAGLGLLILTQISYLAVALFNHGLIEQLENLPKETWGQIYSILNMLYVIGMFLFVWRCYAGLWTKIVMTAKVVVFSSPLYSALYDVIHEYYLPTGEIDSVELWETAHKTMQNVWSWIELGNRLLFFLLLLWAITSWWRKMKPAEELPAAQP